MLLLVCGEPNDGSHRSRVKGQGYDAAHVLTPKKRFQVESELRDTSGGFDLMSENFQQFSFKYILEEVDLPTHNSTHQPGSLQ